MHMCVQSILLLLLVGVRVYVFTHMYAYLLVDIGNVRVMEGLCEMQPLLAKAVLKGGVRLQALTILGADDVQNHLLCSSRQRN